MRPEAEELEEVWRHQPAGRPVRVAAPQDVEGPVAKLDELIERRRLCPVVGDFHEREAGVLDPRRDLRLAQVHDAVGFGVGKRPQQDAVDDAEDRGIGADAEAERQDERERESRHAGQGAQREANIADHGDSSAVHARPSGIVHRHRTTAMSIRPLTQGNLWSSCGLPELILPSSHLLVKEDAATNQDSHKEDGRTGEYSRSSARDPPRNWDGRRDKRTDVYASAERTVVLIFSIAVFRFSSALRAQYSRLNNSSDK